MKYGIQTSPEAEKLCDDIFYGRVYMCGKCRRKNEWGCSNIMCLKECQRMLQEPKEDEQMRLF